jgi:plastocyanin domain-containing protein
MQIIFAVVLLTSTALSNSTRAAHSSNSYPSAVDISNTTTKIIGITLTTHRITTEYNGKKVIISCSFEDTGFATLDFLLH